MNYDMTIVSDTGVKTFTVPNRTEQGYSRRVRVVEGDTRYVIRVEPSGMWAVRREIGMGPNVGGGNAGFMSASITNVDEAWKEASEFFEDFLAEHARDATCHRCGEPKITRWSPVTRNHMMCEDCEDITLEKS